MSNWNKEKGVNKYVVAFGYILLAWALFSATAQARYITYDFPPTAEDFNPNVLMHIQYSHGGGGTWQCGSPNYCYRKVLEYEARGAEHYCRKITIVEDGKVIWWRTYQ